MVGDAIHTVKPYFGLGVNSAFEDVGVLRDSLRSQDSRTPEGLQRALRNYTETHKRNVQTLVKMSWQKQIF